MKPLKFAPHLVPLVLSGEKTVTWRLFDDKNLQVGDELVCVNAQTLEEFAKVRITEVQEKRPGDVTAEDEAGHEPFKNAEERLATYRNYYGNRVTEDSMVKMIRYELRNN